MENLALALSMPLPVTSMSGAGSAGDVLTDPEVSEKVVRGGRPCSNCALSGGDGAGGVHTGLDASEMVVRGGRLSQPLLFCNLIVGSDGKRFVRLKKSHEGLCRFLTGRGSWSRPLASTTVFETLRARRDEILQALVAVSFDRPEASAPGVEEVDTLAYSQDPMALLGIDEPEASEPVQKGPPRSITRMRKDVVLRQDATISVGFEPGCEFLVLSETGSSVPAIELTASSLWNLYRLVNADLEEVVVQPPRGTKASRRSGTSDREPRGSEGQREYWDAQKLRWVQKIRGDNKKYRVLTRKGTGAESSQPSCALAGSEMTDAVGEPESSPLSCALAGSEMTDEVEPFTPLDEPPHTFGRAFSTLAH